MRFFVAALAAALLLLAPAAAAAACPGADPCPYSAAGVIGQRAGRRPALPAGRPPSGPDGSIYVADQYSHAIQVFGPDGALPCASSARRLRPGRLTSVGAVAVAPDGSVYVADGADRIDRFARRRRAAELVGLERRPASGEFHFGAGGGNDSGAGGGLAIGAAARSTSPTRATTGSSASRSTASARGRDRAARARSRARRGSRSPAGG